MKTVIRKKSYAEVMKMTTKRHKKPLRQVSILRKLIRLLSRVDLNLTDFSYDMIGMDALARVFAFILLCIGIAVFWAGFSELWLTLPK